LIDPSPALQKNKTNKKQKETKKDLKPIANIILKSKTQEAFPMGKKQLEYRSLPHSKIKEQEITQILGEKAKKD
jgi:hypothetical protein